MSAQNFGLIREGAGKAVLRAIPVPRLRDDYILVRTVAIALNPTDWTTLDAVGKSGTIVGCDYAGIVEEVGKAVKKTFTRGDRIAGFAHGANDVQPEDGAFARFIVVIGDLQMHVPDAISFEEACTVGVGIGTTGYGLYKTLGLPLPGTSLEGDGATILIYGEYGDGSGRKVITTCSPKHFTLMKELGASEVYDYHIPNIGEQIRTSTDNGLTTVFDTVALESTASVCAAALGRDGGVYCNLLGADCPRKDVKSIFFLGYSLSGESYIFEGDTYEARPEDFVFGVKFCAIAEKLWAGGEWKAHPRRVETGGLLGVGDGMREMREGRVSGEKLVYRIAETEWP